MEYYRGVPCGLWGWKSKAQIEIWNTIEEFLVAYGVGNQNVAIARKFKFLFLKMKKYFSNLKIC